METLSALLAICAGNSPVTGEFPAQRPVTRSFDVFFDLPLNKPLSKQWWGWWFETLSRPLWRHCDAVFYLFLYGSLLHRCLSLPLYNTHIYSLSLAVSIHTYILMHVYTTIAAWYFLLRGTAQAANITTAVTVLLREISSFEALNFNSKV